MVKPFVFLYSSCLEDLKMAESAREETLSNNLPNSGQLTKMECAVCLQTSVHPAELPCGHVFCYLCIKGIVNQGRRCAMCRQDIPVDYLDKPKLLNPVDADITYYNSQGFEDGHLWFYEGHNGWWQYDERTSLELESAYQKGERCCDLLIAGFLYIADFDGMLQYRRNDPSRRRRIKRDLATTTKKGIAGLKPTKNCYLPSPNSSEVSNDVIQNLPVSSSSDISSVNSAQVSAASSNNSNNQQPERVQGPQRLRGISSGCAVSSCIPAISTNSNAVSQTDRSLSYSSNLNLDNAIQDTLDWTIEQIESLNIELLNDYEALFRDVNNYSQLQDSLNQSRQRRTPCNYLGRYLGVRNVSSETHGNNINTAESVPDLSHSSNSNVNNLPQRSPASEENSPVYSEAETGSERFSLQSDSEGPRPPPRSRGMSRSRSRGDPLRHSPSLNCDTLLQSFMFSK